MLAVKPPDLLNSTKLFASLEGIHRLALGVSGGSDSMAMLRLVVAWAQQISPAPEIFVLSVDHGLRAEAADECRQVALWCKTLGVQHHTLHWRGDKPKTGVQAKARAARYDVMAQWCVAHDVPILLTAHTLDDQAETVVMRRERTHTAKSLAGIWPERDWNGIRLVRPLLGVTRERLRQYLNLIGQGWIDDPSNVDPQFERVRIRQMLKGEVSAADEAGMAQAQVQKAVAGAHFWLEQNLIAHETGLLRFVQAEFVGLQAAVQDDVLCRLFGLCGVSKLPELQKRLDLIGWISGNGGTRRTLGGVVFAKQGRDILLGREPGRIQAVGQAIPASGQIIWDGRFMIRGAVGDVIQMAGGFEQIARRKDIPAFIDAGLPVILRENAVLAAPFHGIGAGVECFFVGLKHK